MKHTYRVHYDKANGFKRPWLAIITKPHRKWEFQFIHGNYVKTAKGAMKALDFVIETAGIAPGAMLAFGVSDNPAYGCGKQRVHGTILPSGEIRWLPGTARFDTDEVAELLGEPRHWSDTVPKFDHGAFAELAPSPSPVKEEIYTYSDRPGEEYRKLKVGEEIIPSDAHLTKSAVPRGGGLLSVYLTSGISSTVKESDGNAYFRCINSPHKDLRKATFGLLDYWFLKYQSTCEDEDERRVWQAVIDSLTPNETTK